MNKIAAFDFDGTITSRDTLIEFIKFTKGKFNLYLGFLLFSPLLVLMKIGLYPNWKVKQYFFSFFYRGTDIGQFNVWSENFIQIIEKIKYSKAIQAICEHKKNGYKVIIISASIENWIIPWAKRYEVDIVLSTKIEVDSNNKLTGRFTSFNCYGKEKVNRLLEICPNRSDYMLIAYGDSKGDKELINFADKGFYNQFS